MLLSELEQGAKVLLLLTIDGKHFEFETIVQGKHKHDVLFEPIRKDQKILNVQSDQVDVDIMYMREDDKPILWKEAKMGCIRHKHKIYYASEAARTKVVSTTGVAHTDCISEKKFTQELGIAGVKKSFISKI